jgi:hypothetical protein
MRTADCHGRNGPMCRERPPGWMPITRRSTWPRRWCHLAFRGYVPARHPALRYGLALNDRGYFWESQEVLEAVWAAAPQGGRERILLRACIHTTNANLRLRMQKAHSAARLFGEALAELRTLTSRKAAPGGDGFVECFPVPALTALLQAKLGRAQLTKADWIALSAIVRAQ